jgi:hypothetical protein
VRLAIVTLLLLGISLPATAADRLSKPTEEDRDSYKFIRYDTSQKRAGYRSHRETHSTRYRRVITPAFRDDVCAFKAWRFLIRCHTLGYSSDACFWAAVDFQEFCQDHGL